VKARTWAGIGAAVVVAMCGLPLIAAISTAEPAKACGVQTPAGGRATLNTRAGAVGAWDSSQVDNAAIIVAVGQQKQIPARGWVIAVATAMTESRLINTSTVTDHDSVGLFQQRPSAGWGTPTQLIDPVYTSTKFYTALLKIDGWEAMPLTRAAQAVQRSAYPDRYADFENDAEAVVAKVAGAATITDLPGASLADCGPPAVVSSGGWTRPVEAGIVSGFRTGSRPNHQGVDLGASRNTVIRAASAGRVVFADCDGDTGNCNIDGSTSTPGCGWFVEILHDGGIATRYCHMVRRPNVRYDQHVNAGDPIGVVGTSGHSSGPHLHFEVHINVTCGATRCSLTKSNAIAPAPFMQQHGAALAGS
jgi:murein DD-endopeptidase MepM/ murein hydrolase activator NlpD